MTTPKHEHLRACLVDALPELARNPDKLSIYMTGGRLIARYGPNLGFQYDATLQIDVIGFSGQPAAFFLPLILWLRRYEPAALLNHDTAEQRLRFEIDMVDNGAVDITIGLPMSEAVDVLPQSDGSYVMKLREEPAIVDEEPLIDPPALLRRIFHEGELLVGYPLDDPAP
ncbi:phage tail protein [Sphingobium lignivorans]|uniref:Phage tail protein n=1 Tax=Sphingobium lignivorans TaxID=2735886 RepID=A0ABR6NDF3_9SPHN|nr:phage tail protein [Sphingobium lignivorans]MBB5985303.1 hypothetical protein [Sphingobium lignivorans]